MVDARLDGHLVDFEVSRGAIQDRLHLQTGTMEECREALHDHWSEFVDPIEQVIKGKGNGIVVTTHMINR